MGTPAYEMLTAAERFVLMVEAMARRDDVEADRLEDTCPRFTYRAEDAEFRDRMRRVHGIASRVCLNMRAGLAQIRMAQTFRDVHQHFAGPVARLATAAFLCGRAYRQHEAGIEEPDGASLPDEWVADPNLQEPLGDVRQVAQEAVLQVADTVHYAVGEAHAADLLSQWEGFRRFCEDSLGLDPLSLLRALGLGQTDPAAEVRTAYPAAATDEVEVARWSAEWTRSWQRRFKQRC